MYVKLRQDADTEDDPKNWTFYLFVCTEIELTVHFFLLQGAQAWYIPSTICGAAVLIAGLLVLMLPETKDKEICDTVEEIMERSSRDKVSLRNCCPF
jgi:hypothetical protein